MNTNMNKNDRQTPKETLLEPLKQPQSLSSEISSDTISVVSQENQIKPLPFEKHTISYFMLLLSCICWVLGFIYSNQNNMSPFQTTLSRYTVMLFVTYFHCRMDGSPLVFHNRPHQKTLLFRNIILALHGFVVTVMQFYLPLGIFHTLVISGQIFIFLANYFLKGVKITKNQVIGVIISFIGLGLIINGRFLLKIFSNQTQEYHTDFQHYATTDIYSQIKMGILYVLWNALWAVSVVLTKLPQYSASQILFTQTFTSIPFAAIGYILNDSQSHVSLQTYLPSILYLCFIMAANYLFTYGVMWSNNTGISTMMLMSSALFGYFISVIRYNQQVNWISLVGTVVLVGSAAYIIWEQQKIKN